MSFLKSPLRPGDSAILHRYYREVSGYHERIEARERDGHVVPPALILRFLPTTEMIVDIAGGSGINAEILQIDASRYLCLDLSFEGVQMVLMKNRGVGIQTSVDALPLKDKSISTILCSWSLEHFSNPGAVFMEMIRVLKPGGRIILWGPNWDNVFRKDFPQFSHKSNWFIFGVRCKIFLRMVRNEFAPFRFEPLITLDVAALQRPSEYVGEDADAVHCVLCQETRKFFERKGLRTVHVSDFSEMGKHVRTGTGIRNIRAVLQPLLPMLRRIPLIRWFVLRFPLVLEKPLQQ